MDAMNVIPDEDFDRLWDEAVAEAAVKSIKQQLRSHSRSKGQRYAPSSKQHHSNRRETIAVVHQRVEKASGNESTRRRASESIKNGLTRRPRSESNSHELTRQPRSESNEYGLTRWRSSESLRNEVNRRRSSESSGRNLIRRRSSESNGHDLIRRRSSETNGQELAHRSSSESSGQSRRRSSESSSGHELPHRRSTISKVPSLPRLTELTKDTMYGREDLSGSSYSSGLNASSSNKYAMDDCSSVSSLASGFSGFESVSIQQEQPQRSLASETRRKQLGGTRSKSRSPTRDAKKQKNTEGGQKEVVNYILEADSSEQQQQLLFEIPTIFEVKGHKENRNQTTGLVLTFGRENDNGTVVVKGISPTSLFANTRLKSGHEILMINSHRVKSPQQAAKLMKSLSGDVTIYVSEGTRAPGMKYIRVKAGRKKMINGHTGHIESSLHSAAKDVTLVTRNDRLVRVAHVDPDGAFSKNLSAGDVVITVNGTLVQNDEEAMKLLDTTNHGVICMLIYSMANLWKGMIDQLLPGWKRCWVSEAEVTVSRDNISLSIVWRYDWACECNHSDEEAVDNSDIQSAIGKINVATSFVINSIIEASEVQRKQIALDADCITCTATTDQTTEESADNESDKAGHEPEESRQVPDPSIEEGTDNATTDPTTEESTDNESDKAGHEPEESPQVPDPSIEEGIDNGDVSGESGHAPTETLQEFSKSNRPSIAMHKGISLYLELNGDDESSVEDC
eukprot:scaffold11309_cov126-Skeletonema_dohrnii-CCMP3373.AAC.5